MLNTLFKIRKIKRLQHLISHNEKWAHEIQFAEPIDKLVKGGVLKDSKTEILIKHNIDKLLPVVGQYAKDADIPYHLTYTGNGEENKIDMFVNYHLLREFHQHHSKGSRSSAESFDRMISVLNNLDGYYEEVLKQQVMNALNPFNWLAAILHMPIYIFEKAGIKTGSKVFEAIYAGVVRILVIIALSLLAAKLGISIPWEQVKFLK